MVVGSSPEVPLFISAIVLTVIVLLMSTNCLSFPRGGGNEAAIAL